MTAEEVKPLASPREVDLPRFVGMQLQPESREGVAHPLLGLLARHFRVAHDHEVVRVAHQHAQMRVPARPHRVEHVQVDVRQQRRNHAALSGTRDGRAHLAVFHHACPEPLPYQFEHPTVRDAPCHERHQLAVVDAAEVVANIGVEDMVAASRATRAQCFERLRGVPFRPKAVRARLKVRLENRFQHERRRHLRHSVPDRGNPQGPLPSVSLRNISTPYRRGPIRACAQVRTEVCENTLDTHLLDGGERDCVHARRAAVLLHPSPCFPQDVTPVDAVQQRMKTSARLPLGRTPESALQLAHVVDGRASTGVVGTGLAGHALARACSADVAPAGTLRSARVMLHGPRHYYGPLGFPLRRARFRRWLIRAALP